MGNIEPEKIIQNMDSLWFFTNAVLSKLRLSFPLSPNIKHNNTKNLNSIDTSPKSKTNSAPCQINQPNYCPSTIKEMSPIKLINVEINDVDSQSIQAQAVKAEPQGEEEGSSKRKPRTKKSYSHRQHIIKCTNVEGSGKNNNDKGYHNVVDMLTCNDDEETMKKHLKTWAVAVAYEAVHNTNSLMVVACS